MVFGKYFSILFYFLLYFLIQYDGLQLYRRILLQVLIINGIHINHFNCYNAQISMEYFDILYIYNPYDCKLFFIHFFVLCSILLLKFLSQPIIKNAGKCWLLSNFFFFYFVIIAINIYFIIVKYFYLDHNNYIIPSNRLTDIVPLL